MKDQQRLDAEHQAFELLSSLAGSALPESERVAIEALDDSALRIKLFDLRRGLAARRAALSPLAKSTLRVLRGRVGTPAGPVLHLDEVAQQLDEEYGIRVADDGLIEVERLTDRLRALIGDLPVALYHHTSTALIESIAQNGLLVGQPTNFFNTQAGVYLSTCSAGERVSVYAKRAARVHGGEPATVRVRRLVSQLTDDPDDADLPNLLGIQFISEPLPPEDLWDADVREVQSGLSQRRESEGR